MSTRSIHTIVSRGRLRKGLSAQEVEARLLTVFKGAQSAQIRRLLSGERIVLKKGLSADQAQRYREQLRQTGLECEIEPPVPLPKPVDKSTSGTAEGPDDDNCFRAQTIPADALAPTQSAEEPETAVAPEDAATVKKTPPAKVMGKEALAAYFSNPINKVRLPIQYRLGIVAVGLCMLLLPALYFGLIAAIAVGLVYHITANFELLTGGGSLYLRLLAYATPLLCGAILIFFLFKPIFARRTAEMKQLVLNPHTEPRIFDFVALVANKVGAARPREIVIDCQVNASASFRHGLLGLFSNQLTLTLGMPLLAGFNTRQLAGVLAHEFGHFAQGTGMRFHYLTFAINAWFYRAVFERDSWDEKLVQVARENENWVGVILHVARGMIWLVRRILHGLMQLSHRISSYLLRQMEFDADRYEAEVAGSGQFGDTCIQLHKLSMAMQQGHQHLAQSWEDGRLVEDFPGMIAESARQLPQEALATIEDAIHGAQTGAYDSHPADIDRIENAQQQQAPGIFTLNMPGRHLLFNYDTLTREVTYNHYRFDLGLDVDESNFASIGQFMGEAQQNEADQKTLYKFTGGLDPDPRTPWRVRYKGEGHDFATLCARLSKARKVCAQGAKSLNNPLQRRAKLYDRRATLRSARVLIKAGLTIDGQAFKIKQPDSVGVATELKKVEHALASFLPAVTAYQQVINERLSLALTIMGMRPYLGRQPVTAAAIRQRNRDSNAINTLARIGALLEKFQDAARDCRILLQTRTPTEKKTTAIDTVRKQRLNELQILWDRLFKAIEDIDYPFDHNAGQLTLAEYIEKQLPPSGSYADRDEWLTESAGIVVEKLYAVYTRIARRLAKAASIVEAALLKSSKTAATAANS